MTITTTDQIKQKAKLLQTQNKSWHFHILTPTCKFNQTDDYALVLENVTNKRSWVCYSPQSFMDAGILLVKLLHGDEVMEVENHPLKPASIQVQKIIQKAKQLNQQGKFWHHHLLFPHCQFNQHKSKFVIIFEDQEKEKIIESVTDTEPKSDLQHLESLFYAQKK